jgi:hypothetical protein
VDGEDRPADVEQPGGGRQRDDSIGAALESVAEELVQNVKAEADRLREELIANAGAAGRGAGYLAGSASLGAVSLVAVGTLPLLALRKVLPGSVIAVGIAAGSAAGAVALARRGLDELRVAAPESVEHRIDEAVAAVVETVRARARSVTGG